MVWSSRSEGSLVFVLVHSVLWPLALNTYAGFQGVPDTLRMAGRNYGLKGLRYVLQLLVPAALPSILSGLKIGWAFAWRTLVAAELVFGASSGRGGLGWYIFQNRNELYTDKVFAGLAMVIAIGLAVENLGFHTLERVTVRHATRAAGAYTRPMLRWLLVVFLALVLINGLTPWLRRLGLGRLPGDFQFRLFGRDWFIPLASTVLLSFLLSLAVKWL